MIKKVVLIIFVISFTAHQALGKSYQTHARTVDKFYIYNFFIDIFGNKNKELLYNDVIRRNDLFGGGCLPYNSTQATPSFSIKDPNFQDACNKNISEAGESIFREIGTIRQTHTENLCKKLTSNEQNIIHILAQVDLEKLSNNDLKNLEKVVSIFFYKERQIKKYVHALHKQQDMKWNKIFFILCSSPQWQIL